MPSVPGQVLPKKSSSASSPSCPLSRRRRSQRPQKNPGLPLAVCKTFLCNSSDTMREVWRSRSIETQAPIVKLNMDKALSFLNTTRSVRKTFGGCLLWRWYPFWGWLKGKPTGANQGRFGRSPKKQHTHIYDQKVLPLNSAALRSPAKRAMVQTS